MSPVGPFVELNIKANQEQNCEDAISEFDLEKILTSPIKG
jgi:hypothetical protein